MRRQPRVARMISGCHDYPAEGRTVAELLGFLVDHLRRQGLPSPPAVQWPRDRQEQWRPRLQVAAPIRCFHSVAQRGYAAAGWLGSTSLSRQVFAHSTNHALVRPPNPHATMLEPFRDELLGLY